MWKVGFGLVFIVSACASDSSPFMPGFKVDAPRSGELQVYTEIIHGIQPGADITYCSYLDFTTSKVMDVVGYKGFQSAVGGHHNILYSVNNSQPPNTHECTENDMTNVHYVGGGGTDATVQADQLPAGIVFRVPEQKQLMIVSHWINATDKIIDGQTAYNVAVEDPKPESEPADLFTIVNTIMQVEPGTSQTHTECTLKSDMKFFMLGPHAHEHGTRTVLSRTTAAGTKTTIQDVPWTKELIFNTPLVKFTKDAPFTMATGDKFAIDCTYQNDTSAAIPFPSEMCIGYGYYFPADREVDCLDGDWPN